MFTENDKGPVRSLHGASALFNPVIVPTASEELYGEQQTLESAFLAACVLSSREINENRTYILKELKSRTAAIPDIEDITFKIPMVSPPFFIVIFF